MVCNILLDYLLHCSLKDDPPYFSNMVLKCLEMYYLVYEPTPSQLDIGIKYWKCFISCASFISTHTADVSIVLTT